MTKIFTILTVIVVLLLALSFSVINAHHVQLNYYIGELDIPLSFLVILSLIVGALVGALAMTKSLFGLRLELAKMRRVARSTEKELGQIKSLPDKDHAL